MRNDAVWDPNYGAYVAPLNEDLYSKIAIPLLSIVITPEGYFYTYFRGKRIKKVDVEYYIKYRRVVDSVIGEEYLI